MSKVLGVGAGGAGDCKLGVFGASATLKGAAGGVVDGIVTGVRLGDGVLTGVLTTIHPPQSLLLSHSFEIPSAHWPRLSACL